METLDPSSHVITICLDRTPDPTEDHITSVTTMREDKITTIEHGHCCGTIITERYLANEDHNIMYWTQEVIGTGVKCQRRFKRVAPIADSTRPSIHAL